MDADTARELLQDERRRLQATHDAMEAAVAEQQDSSELSSYDQHPGDTGSETFEREKDSSIVESVAQSLTDIDAALARVDDGSYGSCEVCGRPIADERLEALPAARHCVEHAR